MNKNPFTMLISLDTFKRISSDTTEEEDEVDLFGLHFGWVI